MIIYFSATGNNKYIAQRIAEAVGDELVSISVCMKSGQYNFQLRENESLGFVTPTYFWGLPSIVKEFIERMTIEKADVEPYVYHVLSYGSSTGCAHKDMQKLLEAKKLKLQGRFSVQMVDTWTPMFDLSDPEKNRRDTEAAEPQIDAVIEKVRAKTEGDFNSAKGGVLLSRIVQREYEKKRYTRYFTVKDDCIACGLCAEQCPAQAIELRDGKPVWVKEKCPMCLGCLHRCPRFAIQYAGKTEGRGQFVHPKVKL